MISLERYRPIITDWNAFDSCSQKPLATTFWINHLRIPDASLLEYLRKLDVIAHPIPWAPHAYRMDREGKPGLLWPYKAGLMHVLEEVSMIPPLLLDCQPGDRVLDLCAAPGNKTMLLAAQLAGKGSLVANEFNWGRLAVLRSHLERLGMPGVSTYHHNGTNLNGRFGAFDRILCDVPCSCEGTHRKHGKEIAWGNADFRERLTSTQRALLRKALQLAKIGGRIVYSTCTYAPEENEGVIDSILKEYPGIFRIVPVTIPGFEMCPGISEWEGRVFDAQLQNCCRVYPHLNDTGGFFVAVLEKVATLPAWSNVVEIATEDQMRASVDAPEVAESLRLLGTHFGIAEEYFRVYEYYHKGGDLFAVSPGPRLPLEPEPQSCGLMLLRKTINHPKMPTGFSNLLAPFATRQVVDLGWDNAQAYMRREKLIVDESLLGVCPEDGYVMIRYAGVGLGQATLDRRTGQTVLHSLYPKGLV